MGVTVALPGASGAGAGTETVALAEALAGSVFFAWQAAAHTRNATAIDDTVLACCNVNSLPALVPADHTDERGVREGQTYSSSPAEGTLAR